MVVKKKVKVFLGCIIFILLIMLAALITWNVMQRPVDINAEKEIEVVIPTGLGASQIATILEEKGLIRSKEFFRLYLKSEKIQSLKASTYKLRKNMTLKEIVEILSDGNKYNPDEIKITIQEGLNMREIAEVISKNTSNSYEDVIAKSNDEDYIKSLIDKYWFITDDVLNNLLYYKLEGYLYPATYNLKNSNVDVEYIFDKMLEAMEKRLEPYKNKDFTTMSIHSYLTLASMVEKESSHKTDRKKMASVFMNRLNKNMNLGSDVTAKYANKIDGKRALTSEELNFKSPYNTRLTDGSMNAKLPVGPIASVSELSIDAAFNPDTTKYLYFISNIETTETFFYTDYQEFLKKKNELAAVNKGY